MYLYSASLCLMRYRFPYVGADLRKLVHQPGIQRTLRDHRYRIVYHTVCLFTPFAGTHSSLTTEGRLRLSRPGCLVLRWGGLPVQRLSPTQALTGPSVEYLCWSSPNVTATLNWQLAMVFIAQSVKYTTTFSAEIHWPTDRCCITVA